MNWGVGEVEPIHDLMRDAEVISEHIRFGPGQLIPVRRWPPIILESTANGFDVQRVLNTIGSAVEDELEWDWPTPYDGEQRRAAVRIRLKMREYERHVLYPWQEHLYELASSGKRLVIKGGRA